MKAQERPQNETDDSVYSNFDHALDATVVEQLRADQTLYAQHAAYNFCGYVWFDGEQWHEDVMRYHEVVEHLVEPTVEDVIYLANEKYGSE